MILFLGKKVLMQSVNELCFVKKLKNLSPKRGKSIFDTHSKKKTKHSTTNE